MSRLKILKNVSFTFYPISSWLAFSRILPLMAASARCISTLPDPLI